MYEDSFSKVDKAEVQPTNIPSRLLLYKENGEKRDEEEDADDYDFPIE